MFIKTQKFLDLVAERSSLAAKVELLQGQIERLRQEIDYWREKFESEQNRADRVTDNSMKVSGLPPVTDIGLRDFEKQKKDYEKMFEQAVRESTEMFSDEVPVGKDGDGFEIAPDLSEALLKGLKE